MTLVVLLFAVGILCILVEVIVPGGIFGLFGGLLMVGGSVLAFYRFGTAGGFVALVSAVAAAALALWIQFRLLPRTEVGKRAFLTRQVTGVAAALSEDAKSLIGSTAEALTMLSPSGYVRIDGQRYEAFCQSGQAPAGAVLEVIGADRFRLIVTQRTS